MALHQKEATADTRRITLAVGLFDRVVAIVCVLRDLASHGYDGGRFRIVVADDSQDFDARNIGSLEGIVPICRVPAADLREGATPALWLERALPWLVDPAAAAVVPADPSGDPRLRGAASNVLDRQTRRLAVHLASGGAAMIARIDAIADQQAICSMMLHYASGGVLTHQTRAGLANERPLGGLVAARAAPAAFRCT